MLRARGTSPSEKHPVRSLNINCEWGGAHRKLRNQAHLPVSSSERGFDLPAVAAAIVKSDLETKAIGGTVTSGLLTHGTSAFKVDMMVILEVLD